MPCSANVIDLPGTTSAVTYTVYLRNDDNTTLVSWDAATSVIGAITVKEWGY